MSTLWAQAAWVQDDAEDESTHPEVRPVEKAGFAGWVTSPGMEEEGDQPHHHNEPLMDHLLSHGGDELREMSQHGRIPLNEPVYGTQSHVTERGLAKHAFPAKHVPAEQKPRFIRHQGRLYVDDGHHRVGAALLRGDPSIEGYYFNADKKGFPEPENRWW
jgi:hypothetical protein